MSKKVLMQGNTACVEGALKAGMRFFAGYPITPSTEIAEKSAENLPKYNGKFIQMEDELAAMAAVVGASSVGVKSMTATSGPGFSLKQENLGYACMAEIPCVVVDVQRCGPSTGLPTSPSQGDVMQAKWGTHGDHPIIAISPSSVSETYYLAIRCFNLAEKYKTPVIFLMDEIVGHLREGVEINDENIEIIERRNKEIKDTVYDGYNVSDGELVPKNHLSGPLSRYNITGLAHGDDGFPTNNTTVAGKLIKRLIDKVEKNRDDICQNEEYLLDDADICVLCYGGTARSVKTAVDLARNDGLKVGMFRPITLWPSPIKEIEKLSLKCKKILVVEHNEGQYVLEVERICKGNTTVEFFGREDGTVISPNEILNVLKGEK